MSLTISEAKIVLGMLARGDHNHDVAAWFGVNPARIAEVKAGEFGTLAAAPSTDLPPRGAPGVKGRHLRGKAKKALEALNSGDAPGAKAILEDALAKYEEHQS